MVDEDEPRMAKKGKGRGLKENKGRGGKKGKGRDDMAAVAPKHHEPGPLVEPVQATVVNKRAFMGRVAEACDLSTAQVRLIVEATLAEMGRAIASGETLALPPFGKARVSRQKTVKGGDVLIVRLRRPDPGVVHAKNRDDD